MAQSRLVRMRTSQAVEERAGDLQSWVPKLSPKYLKPAHLKKLTDLIEAAVRGEPQRVVIHAPPRHAKTETVLHSISWGLKRRPELKFGYGSYNNRIALAKSRVARDLTVRAGIQLAKNASNEWRTPQEGGLLAGGVGSGFTGFGLDIAFLDDVFKDRVEAESANRRETVDGWYRDVIETRIEPGGSVFVFMTRWHPDDLSGRLIKEGWPYICLPALEQDAEGNEHPLWGERWSLEALQEKRLRLGPYSFESLYQGAPRPRGGSVFGDSIGYDEPPFQGRFSIGVDLAYSEKTSSDWSVIVVMKEDKGLKYVVDVARVQMRPPQFLELAKQFRKRYPTARWRWYASGTEQGAASFMRKDVPIEVLTPRGDKFTRAIPYAAAWNARRVLVPGGSRWEPGIGAQDAEPPPPWLEEFLSEHADFTGVKDPHDDQVDAAVAAFDLLDDGTSSKYESFSDRGIETRGRRM